MIKFGDEVQVDGALFSDHPVMDGKKIEATVVGFFYENTTKYAMVWSPMFDYWVPVYVGNLE